MCRWFVRPSARSGLHKWWCVLFVPLVTRAAICIYVLVYLLLSLSSLPCNVLSISCVSRHNYLTCPPPTPPTIHSQAPVFKKNIKYAIRSIVCEASCHPVTRSLGHLVTRSLGHSVTQALGHSVTCSLSHSVTIFNITTNGPTDGQHTGLLRRQISYLRRHQKTTILCQLMV